MSEYLGVAFNKNETATHSTDPVVNTHGQFDTSGGHTIHYGDAQLRAASLRSTANGGGLLIGETGTGTGVGQRGSTLRLASFSDTEQAYLVPATGMLLWNTSDTEPKVYNGSAWVALGGGSGLSGLNTNYEAASGLPGTENQIDINATDGPIILANGGSTDAMRFNDSQVLSFGTGDDFSATFNGSTFNLLGAQSGGTGYTTNILGSNGVTLSTPPGVGGATTIKSGDGGDCTSSYFGGVGGLLTLAGGDGGDSAAGPGGGVGGAVEVVGGSGGAYLTTVATGGSATLQGGASGTNGTGGSVYLNGGVGDSLTDGGAIYIGRGVSAHTTSAIEIGSLTSDPPVDFVGAGQISISPNVDMTGGLDLTTVGMTTADNIPVYFGSGNDFSIRFTGSQFQIAGHTTVYPTGYSTLIQGSPGYSTVSAPGNAGPTSLVGGTGGGGSEQYYGGGDGGTLNLTGGLGGSCPHPFGGVGGDGGSVVLSGGKGGNSPGAVGPGGAVFILGGDVGDSTNFTNVYGGNVEINGGAGVTGSGGYHGDVYLGGTSGTPASSTGNIYIGNSTTNPPITFVGNGQVTIPNNVDISGGVDLTSNGLTLASNISVRWGSSSENFIAKFDTATSPDSLLIQGATRAANPTRLAGYGFYIVGSVGTANSGNGSGDGGLISVKAGNGNTINNALWAGDGGAMTLSAGDGGDGHERPGDAGHLTIKGGDGGDQVGGGAHNEPGLAGHIYVRGGDSGAYTGTRGPGGNAYVRGGDGVTDGLVYLGDSNTTRVEVGQATSGSHLRLVEFTTTQRNAIASPQAGSIVYNTTDDEIQYYDGAAWNTAGGSGLSGLNTNYQAASGLPGTENTIVINATDGPIILDNTNPSLTALRFEDGMYASFGDNDEGNIVFTAANLFDIGTTSGTSATHPVQLITGFITSGSNASGVLTLSSGDNQGTGNSGNVFLKSGSVTSGTSGNLSVAAGGVTTGTAGTTTVEGGPATGAATAGGTTYLRGGSSSGTGNGGNAYVDGGAGTAGGGTDGVLYLGNQHTSSIVYGSVASATHLMYLDPGNASAFIIRETATDYLTFDASSNWVSFGVDSRHEDGIKANFGTGLDAYWYWDNAAREMTLGCVAHTVADELGHTIAIGAGAAADASGSTPAGIGGTVVLAGGTGGNASTTSGGIAERGGDIQLGGGTGGIGNTNNTTSAVGGGVSIFGGQGGEETLGSGTSGTGGPVSIVGGTPGAYAGGGSPGDGGPVLILGGFDENSIGGVQSGDASMLGGPALNVAGNLPGDALVAGGQNRVVDGTGGDAYLEGGESLSVTDGAGGDAYVRGGAGLVSSSPGNHGIVYIADQETTSVIVGNNSDEPILYSYAHFQFVETHNGTRNIGLQVPTYAGASIPTIPTYQQTGDLVYDDTNDDLYAYTGAGWQIIGGASTGGGGTLDQAYDYGGPGVGKKINVDSGPVELEHTAAADNTLYLQERYNSSNTAPVLYIQFDDSEGTDTYTGFHYGMIVDYSTMGSWNLSTGTNYGISVLGKSGATNGTQVGSAYDLNLDRAMDIHYDVPIRLTNVATGSSTDYTHIGSTLTSGNPDAKTFYIQSSVAANDTAGMGAIIQGGIGGTGTVGAGGVGGNSRLYGGAGGATATGGAGGAGGAVYLFGGIGGNSTGGGNGGAGGGINISSGIGGSGASDGASGSVLIYSGIIPTSTSSGTGVVTFSSGAIVPAGNSADTGAVNLVSGGTLGTGDTGAVSIYSGTTTTGTTGNVSMYAGIPTGAGTRGNAGVAGKGLVLGADDDEVTFTGTTSPTGGGNLKFAWGGVPAAVGGYGKGTLWIDVVNGKLYINTGNNTTATWTVVGRQT